MILVDSRIGSEDLLPQLQKRGFPVEMTRLDYGDVAFEGKGAGGASVNIGIELKKVTSGDLASSIRSGRLSGHQLPGLVGPEGTYDHAWLLVEGRWKVNHQGQLLVLRGHTRRGVGHWVPAQGGLRASEMQKKILTLELCGGLHVRYTPDRDTTLQFLGDLYRWWTDKPLDSHASHLAEHEPHAWLQLSDFRTIVKRFPGVGLKGSLAAEQHFKKSLTKAVTAGVDEWAKIQTIDQHGRARKLGTKVATGVVDFLRGIK